MALEYGEFVFEFTASTQVYWGVEEVVLNTNNKGYKEFSKENWLPFSTDFLVFTKFFGLFVIGWRMLFCLQVKFWFRWICVFFFLFILFLFLNHFLTETWVHWTFITENIQCKTNSVLFSYFSFTSLSWITELDQSRCKV